MDLAFSLKTYDERVSRALARMKELELDALIVNMPDNINWLCGFDSIGYLWYQALVLSPGLAAPVFVTRTTEEPCVREASAVRDARCYDISTTDPIDVVRGILDQAGVGAGRIGVEKLAFTLLPAQWERLQAGMPGATFVESSLLVAELRLVKSDQEIAFQRRAAQMADYAMRAAFEAMRPGMSEIELSGVVAAALADAGSEYAAIPPMVTSGSRSSMIHGMAGSKTLQLGDTVILEHAGVCRRYHAVVMRTAVLGRPTERLTSVAACLHEALDAAERALVPGGQPAAANAACDAVTDRLGITGNRAHRIGYSLGIAYPPTWLEAMMLAEGDPHTVATNMSFTLEPNLAFPDEGFGYKLGDTVLVGSERAENLSDLDRGLTIID